MRKEEALQIIKLLSAMESWALAQNKQMPEYLLQHLRDALDVLERVVLE